MAKGMEYRETVKLHYRMENQIWGNGLTCYIEKVYFRCFMINCWEWKMLNEMTQFGRVYGVIRWIILRAIKS